MITNISVRKKNPKYVVYMPYWVAPNVKALENSLLISIYDNARERADFAQFPEGTPRVDFAMRFGSSIDIDEAVAAVEQHQPKNIIVHCSMGLQRSPWVAKHMIDKFGYELMEEIELLDGGIWQTEYFHQNCRGFK